MPIAKDACKVLSTLALWILWRDELKKPQATAATPRRWRVLVNAWLCRQVLECAQSSAALASVRWQALRVVLCLPLLVLPHLLSASEPNSWSLASPDGKCEIIVSLGEDGSLSYQVLHEGKTVLHKSPLGLRLNDQSFERALSFERAGETESKREKYELFAGTAPRVDHPLTHRTLAFRNSNKASMVIDLAASDEGVAFRYRFPEKSLGTLSTARQGRNRTARSVWSARSLLPLSMTLDVRQREQSPRTPYASRPSPRQKSAQPPSNFDYSRSESPYSALSKWGPCAKRPHQELSNAPGSVRVVQAEATGFALPLNARGWLQPYHAAGPYTPAYEDFYFHVSPGDPPPDSRAKAVGWSFPALFHVPDAGTWALLTESGTDESYCACHLDPDSSGGLYRIAFPLANETTKGWTNKFGPEPRWTLPWTMPWRVIVLGNSAGDIAMSTFVTDLAPPSRIGDTSWIKPGRASWAWWSYPDGPFTAERFDEFTAFAAKMGWEYTLFDANWWKPGLTNLTRYAQAKGISPLAWLLASNFYDPTARKKKVDEMAAAGIRGVKVDFWCSDRQEAIAAMQALFKEAAARRMVVNLHGCTIPRGWQRTWPNFLTCEAVLGSESYFYEPRYTEKAAELDTVLPFTRNVVGPMDLTPVACSPKKYPRLTTAAHQLAAALIFTSGLIHYADKPEFFESLPPEALKVFRDAPAHWDETRCLMGEPGKVAVFARRSGKSWFIAGINGADQPLSANLDLSQFKEFHHQFVVAEGDDAKMQVAVTLLKTSNEWQHEIPPRGGFILRLNK